jgi:hypothetical protein
MPEVNSAGVLNGSDLEPGVPLIVKAEKPGGSDSVGLDPELKSTFRKGSSASTIEGESIVTNRLIRRSEVDGFIVQGLTVECIDALF